MTTPSERKRLREQPRLSKSSLRERAPLAYATCRVSWRGQVFEHELEVSDAADIDIIRALAEQAYRNATGDLIAYHLDSAAAYAAQVEPRVSPLAEGALEDYAKADVDPEGFVRDATPARPLPAVRQCRAIVIRQKLAGEVRESCGYQLDKGDDGSLICPNTDAHLREEDDSKPSLKQELAQRYIDRFATSPPENATIDWLQRRLRKAEDHPANLTYDADDLLP